MGKTNVMRLLDERGIDYIPISYDPNIEVDGETIAEVNNLNPNQVFKTLVTKGKSKEHYVFVLPVNEELDLKKAAKAVNEKKIEMLHLKNLKALTGYIRGGCTPIGMKHDFLTIIDKSALNWDIIYISAGKKGEQIGIDPKKLLEIINGSTSDLIEED